MDSGLADIAKSIESMNYNIAKAQKIGLHHDKGKEKRVEKQLGDNAKKSSKVKGVQ
jgi:hypothetical protein